MEESVNTCVVLRSSASAEQSASVACVEESLRHHPDASGAPRQSAILRYTIPGYNFGRNFNLACVYFL